MDEQFPDGIDTMPPGTDLGALLETWLPRQRDLPSAHAVALARAAARQTRYWVARDQACSAPTPT
jgi:hypothetical protein